VLSANPELLYSDLVGYNMAEQIRAYAKQPGEEWQEVQN
jgi:hypothetical protein